MTHNEKVKKTKDVVKRWAIEMYGFDAKFNPEKKAKWDELMEIVRWLDTLKEGR